MPARFVVKKTLTLVVKITKVSQPTVTFRTRDIWDSFAYPSIRRRIFISWKPPSPSFMKVNFNGSVMDEKGKAEFVIHDLDSWLIVTGSVQLMETSVLKAELRTAWKGICYARLTL